MEFKRKMQVWNLSVLVIDEAWEKGGHKNMTNHGYLEEHQHFCKRHQKCNKEKLAEKLKRCRSKEPRTKGRKCKMFFRVVQDDETEIWPSLLL